MRHSKAWLTCDRCKKEIKIKVGSEIQYKCFGVYSCDPSPVFDGGSIICEIKKVELVRLRKAYDLCPKCRKDFERFMRNE